LLAERALVPADAAATTVTGVHGDEHHDGYQD
jgi:hypothetical protein